MTTRFARICALIAPALLWGCAHHQTLPETTAAPKYSTQDLEEAAAAVTGRKGMDERVSMLETQVKVLKIELSRVSGATERIEARQISTAGVSPEPSSRLASLADQPVRRMHAMKRRTPLAKAHAVDPRDPWATQAETPAAASAPVAAVPATPAATEASKDAPSAPAPAPAEMKTASAEPVPQKEPDSKATAAADDQKGAKDYAVQLGAYASVEKATAEWESLKARGGALLADLLPKREEVSTGGKAMYRLKAGPLPNTASAKARCDGLKAKGLPCVITTFSGEWPSS